MAPSSSSRRSPDDAELVAGDDVLGVGLERLRERAGGVVQLAEVEERHREAVAGGDGTRVQLDRAARGAGALGHRTPSVVTHGELEVGAGICVVERDRLLESTDRVSDRPR